MIHYTCNGTASYCHSKANGDSLSKDPVKADCFTCQRLLEMHTRSRDKPLTSRFNTEAARDNLRASMYSVRRVNPYMELGKALFWGGCAGVLAWTVMAEIGGVVVGVGVASALWVKSCRKAQIKGE